MQFKLICHAIQVDLPYQLNALEASGLWIQAQKKALLRMREAVL
jgi:hypothetical protein